ncbi:MAG TPA: response regulator [Candidatus Eisenbacteria bacterium]
MSLDFEPAAGAAAGPGILVVDDDRRVLELLEVALGANGYRVMTAVDGDEAIRRALGDRPDLIVLDLRLPKKSGLEVCEHLRQDADDPYVPIILVSAAVESDTRIQAFRRGADDYLTKPFSPKELVARIRRLLARSAEGATARRRARELELELSHAREDLRRAHDETRRAERLRDLAFGIGRELHRSADTGDLARRLLGAVQSRLAVGMAALLLPGADGQLEPGAIRGDGLERIAALELEPGGELAALIAGLGRPVTRRELERLPELREAVAPFAAAGIALLAPLRGPEGLDALLVADERVDGAETPAADLDLLRGLCDIAAVALQNVRRHHDHADGALELIAERARAGRRPDGAGAPEPLHAEALDLVVRAARACLLPPRERALLGHALTLGRWGWSAEGRGALERIGRRDATGTVHELARLLEGARALAFDPDESPDERRASLLIAVAFELLAARAQGSDLPEALAAAIERAGEALDPATAQALRVALRDALPAATGIDGAGGEPLPGERLATS